MENPIVKTLLTNQTSMPSDTNRLHQPAIWRNLIILFVLLIIFCVAVVAVWIVHCDFSCQIKRKAESHQSESSHDTPIPAPDIRWPLYRNLPEMSFVQRGLFRTRRHFSACPYFVVDYSKSSVDSKKLVSDCNKNNIDERIFAFKNFDYTGKPITIYAPDFVKKPKTYYGNYCNAEITNNYSEASSADVVLISSMGSHESFQTFERPSKQIWVMHFLESPGNSKNVLFFNGMINYTASYRSDADIITRYGGFIKCKNISKRIKQISTKKPTSAIWVASNCWTSNARKELAQQLGNFYKVDIYGKCGDKRVSAQELNQLLNSKYRYYLAFENSNCEEYITEKVFTNAFKYDMIPIVYGARKEDYEKLLPSHSYIYFGDFINAEKLAEYLKNLDDNEAEYLKYFEWKQTYTPVDFNIFERLCSIVNHAPPKVYHNLENWWQSKTCNYVLVKDLWDESNRQ